MLGHVVLITVVFLVKHLSLGDNLRLFLDLNFMQILGLDLVLEERG